MELQELRMKIDEIDSELVKLFQQRMDVAADVAVYKRQNHLPVLDMAREREKQAALAFFKALPLTQYTVLVCEFANWASTAPLPCFVIKK